MVDECSAAVSCSCRGFNQLIFTKFNYLFLEALSFLRSTFVSPSINMSGILLLDTIVNLSFRISMALFRFRFPSGGLYVLSMWVGRVCGNLSVIH